ncbi:hypothetical protein KQX54_008179 [Cotesia glomerata]|uniref:Uncharacterized protein n=1 Tax=Cotesia glomerata TaxID=32391 RepID=A0AAV7J5F2_COTGL|nr:hypothetical protein KQX54_008179 [Cotesia glomerata]
MKIPVCSQLPSEEGEPLLSGEITAARTESRLWEKTRCYGRYVDTPDDRYSLQPRVPSWDFETKFSESDHRFTPLVPLILYFCLRITSRVEETLVVSQVSGNYSGLLQSAMTAA